MEDSTLVMLSIQDKRPFPNPKSTSTTMDKEIDELLKSRNRLVQSKSVSFITHLEHLLSYYNSLSKIMLRYTVALERSGLEVITFSWQDSFKPSKSYTHTSIRYEKVVIIFNIAAVYSQIGATQNRTTQEGLKEAFKAFKSAAAALRFLRERFGGGESADVSRECVGMLETLMVAQTQECFFQMAVRSGKLSSACSQVARQVELYYEEVHRALIMDPLHRQMDKAWFSHVQLKASLFYAESCYHYALNLHSKDLIGEETTRLRMGIDRLKNTRKPIKGISSCLIKVLSRLEKIMSSSLEKAEKENNSIYYMRVPSPNSLTDLTAYVMERPSQLESLTASEESDCSGSAQ